MKCMRCISIFEFWPMQALCRASFISYLGHLSRFVLISTILFSTQPEGNGALHVAASAGALSAVKFLLSLASNAPPFPHNHLSATNDDNSHANNNRRQVYTHPWSLNALNRQHSTPAIVAAKAGHNDVVQELILRGCDLDAVDQVQHAVLFFVDRICLHRLIRWYVLFRWFYFLFAYRTDCPWHN